MHEVAIIGGGPGGSTTANLLARAGHDVVLFEKERFPRFHIGESLLPHNVRIFERLGIMGALGERFIEKWGVEFVSSSGDHNRLFHFEQALTPRYPMCFQVLRSEFDHLLLREAASRGARVLEGTRVVEANRAPDGTWRLATESEGKAAAKVEARFLIDASGRDGFLARKLGLREMDPALRKAAVFAHYRGVPRREGRDSGNIVIILMRDGWFWMIPFSDGKTSVGLVADGTSIREQGLSPEATLARAIERCPAARDRMREAERVSDVYAASDWTFACRGIAGEGYLLVGDAAAFIDPVFSSGVLLAMSSGELAADLLHEAFVRSDLSPRRFRTYERAVRRHVRAYYRMVSTFYGPVFPEMSFAPATRFGITESVIGLLAGDMEPPWSTRLRLEFFYLVASLGRRLPLSPPVPLHRVFEAKPDVGGASITAAA